MADWDDIGLVLAIVRAGGLSQAARVLSVSHSTLSRRIAALEKQTGVRLFDRVPGGISPTAAGLEMATAGERIEAEVMALDLSLAGRDLELEGELKVTAPALLIEAYLGQVLRDFGQVHPNIELRINGAHQPLNLARREADVAIRATNDPPENLFGRRVAQQYRGVYAAEAYFKYRDEMHVSSSPDTGHDWLGFDWWTDAEVAEIDGGRIAARFDDMSALIGGARAGMGLARLPCFLGDHDARLVRLSEFPLTPYMDFWVLTHPSLKEVSRVRAFMRFVSARFDADQSRFIGQSVAETK